MSDTLIARLPPDDGRDWDAQCARCGSSTLTERCRTCDGEGVTEPGDLYEEDPLWYSPDDVEPCHICDGVGGWRRCISGEEWCRAHPIPGREAMEPGAIEWFVVERAS